MASRILNLEFPTVEPTGATSASGENIPTDAKMFGAFGAKAAEEVGGGLQKSSTAVADINQFWGQIQTDDVTNSFMKDANGVLDHFRTLRGADALNAQEDTNKQLDDLAVKHRETLNTPAQQYQYDSLTRNFRNRYASGIVSTHATAEANSHASATNASAFDLALNGAANSAEDPGLLETFRHDAREAAVRQVMVQGNSSDPAIVSDAIAKADKAVFKTAAEVMGAKNPDAAIKFAEAHRNELGDQFDNVYGNMRERAAAQQGGQLAAEKIQDAKRGTFAPTTNGAISNVATRYGIDPNDLSRAVQIESGGNPRAQTGSYKGILQLSQPEFDKYKLRPDASIWNTTDNLEAGAAKMKAEGDQFARNFSRQPSGFDNYMIHQQGLAGYSSHLANPEAPAWQNMLSTGEGRQKGAGWAKAAIWGNIPDQYKATFGNVDNVTSRDFINMWAAKYGGGAQPEFAPTGGLNVGTRSGSPLLAPAPQGNSFQGSVIPIGLNEGRGNFETAAFPVGAAAAYIKPNVIQSILDDPRSADPRVRDHAITAANRELAVQEIAENQGAKAKKEASDRAAGGYVTTMYDMMHSPQPDYVALAGKVNHDDSLEWRTKQELMEHIKRVSGEEQALSFGPGYLAAREGLFSPPDAPGHISDFTSLVTRNDITTAGLADLQHRFSLAKGSVDKSAGEKIVNSFLKYAQKQLSFEEDNGFIKIRDPKGEAIYNTEFLPKFVRRVSELQDEAEKTGNHDKLDKFLTRENVAKMVQSLRDPREMAADKIAATGQTGGEPEAPNLPLPAAPEGIDANGWRGVVANPPNTSQGRMTHAVWGSALETLAANPTPDVIAAFDRRFGAGKQTAADALKAMGINPQAAALAARAEGATPAGQEQRFPPTHPTVPPGRSTETLPSPAAPLSPAPAQPAFHGGRVTPPTEAEIQAQEREVAERRAEDARRVEHVRQGTSSHPKAEGTPPVRGAEAIREQAEATKARTQEQLRRLDEQEATARENITSKRQLERELKRIADERASLK